MSAALASCGGSSHRAGVRGPSEVRAEPVSKAVANPFTSAVGQDTSGVTPPPAAGGANGPATYRGDLPGLYGGTRNHSTCDAQKLVTFLDQNPAKATAWASTLGIGTTQIRTYVSGLTAVTLRTDTRVTNHGFVDGRANPIQSVLEAGTAVFVNRYGEPVVKCYCGNPLTSPVLYTTPTYVGPLWSGFSSTHITIIDRSTTIIDTFTLVDLSTGKTFQQPAGTSARTGGAPSGTGQPGTPAPPAGQPSPQPQGQASTPGPAAENPSASFSPSSGHQGDTFTLTASGFRPGATLHVTLTRPDGVVEDYSITTGSDGSGSHTFANTANVVTGTYHATIANPATGAQAEASVDVAPASSP
jgi:hypothetical protein